MKRDDFLERLGVLTEAIAGFPEDAELNQAHVVNSILVACMDEATFNRVFDGEKPHVDTRMTYSDQLIVVRECVSFKCEIPKETARQYEREYTCDASRFAKPVDQAAGEVA